MVIVKFLLECVDFVFDITKAEGLELMPCDIHTFEEGANQVGNLSDECHGSVEFSIFTTLKEVRAFSSEW